MGGGHGTDSFARDLGAVSNRSEHVLVRQLRILREQLIDRGAARQLVENERYPDPRTLDARLTKADLRVDANTLQQWVHSHRGYAPRLVIANGRCAEPTRREAEICRLEWQDNDAKIRTGVVRDIPASPAVWCRWSAPPRCRYRVYNGRYIADKA